MKKLILLLSIFVYLLLPGRIFAQDQTYDQIFKEYRDSLESYDDAHGDYQLARSQYLKLGTLTAKNDAKEKTLKMLVARDEVVINYLNALKEKIKTADGITESKQSALTTEIGAELVWFQNHQADLVSAGSLEDLVADSLLAAERWEGTNGTMEISHRILAELSFGKVSDYQTRLDNSFGELLAKVEVIRAEEREEYKLNTRKIEIIDRWLFETEGRISRGSLKQESSLQNFGGFIQERSGVKLDTLKVYNGIVSVLLVALQDFGEATLFMKEIVEEIKTE